MLMIFALQCLTETRNLPVYFFTFCTTLQKKWKSHLFGFYSTAVLFITLPVTQ